MAEETRGLHDHAGEVRRDAADQILDAVRIRRQAFDVHVQELHLGFRDVAIVRMHTARDQRLARLVTRAAIATASAQAVAPSYMEALATSMPVMSATWLWNSKIACSVPWLISGW
jgi:hypothetical protein